MQSLELLLGCVGLEPQLLDALDGVPDLGPRHVALLEQAPDTRTAPHSDLQAYTATLYVLVAGSGGVVVDAMQRVA